jgi:hypothetical protein
MTREQLRALLGEPDAIGGTSRKYRRPRIWKYGNIEYHFVGESLALIFDDTEESEKENTMNLFEYATRNKLRFPSTKGELSVEQLWDVPLLSGDSFNLDAIAKTVNKSLKDSEPSFVETKKSVEQGRQEVALDVVKFVIQTKLNEKAAAEKRAENKIKRESLLKALAEKQAGQLSAMSEKELRKQIEALSEE